MKTTARYKTVLLIITALVLIGACVMLISWFGSYGGHTISLHGRSVQPTVDPHEGQVYINDGFGMVWMTPLEGVDANPFTPSDFAYIDGRIDYLGSDYTTLRGVDVSEHQHEIDWLTVKASGIDFAIIRAAYRGYTEGGVFKDAYAEKNLAGATEAGLKVGVYFFSQAISREEAVEEANFVLDIIKDYEISMPVVYDWEKIEDNDAARTNGLPGETLDDCALAFCETVKAAGYEPCVYFNRHLGYYRYDLSKLTDYLLWVSVPGEYPDFYYAADLWQYSFTESVPGIPYENDVNLMFIPVPESEKSADTKTVTVTIGELEEAQS